MHLKIFGRIAYMHILPGVVLVTETIRARDRVKENERVLLELVRDVGRRENHERERDV